jgi:hypothetical protein
LIEQVRLAGLPVGAVLPATLMLRPDSLPKVTSGLRQEFANPAKEFQLSALRGIVYWVDRSLGRRDGRNAMLRNVPPDLLREIGIGVTLRRPDSISVFLDCAFHATRRLQSRTDEQFIRSLLVGLDYLLAETEYRERVEMTSRYAYEEIPYLRFQAGRLANLLAGLGFQNDPVIQRWSEACARDTLPEVRRLLLDPGS